MRIDMKKSKSVIMTQLIILYAMFLREIFGKCRAFPLPFHAFKFSVVVSLECLPAKSRELCIPYYWV